MGDNVNNRVLILAAAVLGACWLATVGHTADFDANAATEAYLATVTGEARAKSDAYFEGGYWLLLWDTLYAIGVSLVLLFTRIASGLRSLAERIMPWRWLQTLFFAVMFSALTAALTPYATTPPSTPAASAAKIPHVPDPVS